MRIHPHITKLAATLAAIGAMTPIAGAVAAPNRAGGALAAPVANLPLHSVSAPSRTYWTGARFVPQRVWQEINDGLLVKLLNRP